MPADRTERKPTAYERICVEACEWCAKGFKKFDLPTPPTSHHLPNGFCGDIVPCTAPSRDAVIESQAAERQRLFDLVRYCRHTLHADGLISDQEFSDILVGGSSGADGGSVKRLGSYDEVRAGYAVELAALKQERDELRADKERLALALLDVDTLLYALSMEFCHIDKTALEFCATQRLRIETVLNGDILALAQKADAARTAQQEGKP